MVHTNLARGRRVSDYANEAARNFRRWLRFTASQPSSYAIGTWVVVLLLVWIWPRLNFPKADADNPHLLYFFSTIAQSLAAIVALVFTISLVIAQMASQYSFRLSSRFFDVPTMFYIAIFGAGVLFPVWKLGYPTVIGAKISFSIASACVIFLIPYFLSFRRKLDPSVTLMDLHTAAVRAIRKREHEEPAETRLIQNITLSSCGLRDYETYATGLTRLGEVYIAAERANHQAAGEVLVRFRESCLSTISDPVAVLRSAYAFRILGSAAESAELPLALEAVLKEFGIFATTCVEHSIEAGIDNSVIGIGILAANAAKKQHRDTALTAINQLKILAAGVTSAKKDGAGGWCVWALGRIAIGAEDLIDVMNVARASIYTMAVGALRDGRFETARRAVESLLELGLVLVERGDSKHVVEMMHRLDSLTKTPTASSAVGALDLAGKALSDVRTAARAKGIQTPL